MTLLFNSIKHIANVLDRIYRAACFIGLVAMLFFGAMEIFFRFVFNHSFVWVPGMVILCSNWMIFLGMGVYLHRRQNMEVSYFYNQFFKPRIQKLTDLAVDVFLAIILVVLFKNTILVILMERYQSSLINIPMKAYWYTIPLLLGCFLAILSRIEGIMEVLLKKENKGERSCLLQQSK